MCTHTSFFRPQWITTLQWRCMYSRVFRFRPHQCLYFACINAAAINVHQFLNSHNIIRYFLCFASSSLSCFLPHPCRSWCNTCGANSPNLLARCERATSCSSPVAWPKPRGRRCACRSKCWTSAGTRFGRGACEGSGKPRRGCCGCRRTGWASWPLSCGPWRRSSELGSCSGQESTITEMVTWPGIEPRKCEANAADIPPGHAHMLPCRLQKLKIIQNYVSGRAGRACRGSSNWWMNRVSMKLLLYNGLFCLISYLCILSRQICQG